VTAGDVILCSELAFSGGTAVLTSPNVTWSTLPISSGVVDQATTLNIGKVNTTASDTQTVTGTNQKVGVCAEFSNVQAIFDEIASQAFAECGETLEHISVSRDQPHAVVIGVHNPLKPSHLISKSQSECENGARGRDSGNGWNSWRGT
jgi:hypothetical protein